MEVAIDGAQVAGDLLCELRRVVERVVRAPSQARAQAVDDLPAYGLVDVVRRKPSGDGIDQISA